MPDKTAWERAQEDNAKAGLLLAWGKLRRLVAIDASIGVHRDTMNEAEGDVRLARGRCEDWNLDAQAIVDQFEEDLQAAIAAGAESTRERRP